MGLVVELPPGSLEAPGLAAAAGEAQAPPADLFAALLAVIEAAPAEEGAPLPQPPVLPKRAPAGDPAAAPLPALFLAVPLTAPAEPDAPAAPPAEQAPPVPAPAAEARQPLPAPLPGSGAAPGPAAAAPSEAQSPGEPSAAADARPAPSLDQLQPAATVARELPGGPSEPPPAESPAIEPPGAKGVVRSAGNASADTEIPLPPGTLPREERRAAGDRPLPRAAEPAIQHAAPASAVARLREAAPAEPQPPAVEPAPAPEPPAPDAVQNLDAVATAVIERVEAGGGEARIRLEPAGLGEITIRLHARHDAVHVDVHAETPEAVQLLRDAAADLASLLGQRGMNLAGLNVGLGTRQGEAGGWEREPQQRPAPRDGEFAAILGIDDPAAAARHQRLRAAYNPDGSLLYRV